jgi:hypothetical protein
MMGRVHTGSTAVNGRRSNNIDGAGRIVQF